MPADQRCAQSDSRGTGAIFNNTVIRIDASAIWTMRWIVRELGRDKQRFNTFMTDFFDRDMDKINIVLFYLEER